MLDQLFSLLFFYERPLKKVLNILYLPKKPKIKKFPKKVFNKSIVIKNIHYKFPSSNISILKDINLEIKNGEKIVKSDDFSKEIPSVEK